MRVRSKLHRRPCSCLKSSQFFSLSPGGHPRKRVAQADVFWGFLYLLSPDQIGRCSSHVAKVFQAVVLRPKHPSDSALCPVTVAMVLNVQLRLLVIFKYLAQRPFIAWAFAPNSVGVLLVVERALCLGAFVVSRHRITPDSMIAFCFPAFNAPCSPVAAFLFQVCIYTTQRLQVFSLLL